MNNQLEEILAHSNLTLNQFRGNACLSDLADDEPILGAAADGFEVDALEHLGRYKPLARFVARRMAKRGIALPYIHEMGPGPGLWAVEAAQLMPRAIIDAFDLSPDMVAKANQRFAQHGLAHRVQALQLDMRRVYRESSAQADLVFSRNMLHRLPDLEPALLAMLHAAKPNGEVFVTCFVRVAELSSSQQARFVQTAMTKAQWPELQRAFAQAHILAHSYRAYELAAARVSRVAGARFTIWTGSNNEVYLHFVKGGTT